MDANEKTVARLRAMSFDSLYSLYRTKVERKGRSSDELDAVLSWLTGRDVDTIVEIRENGTSLGEFLDGSRFHDDARLVTGLICGVRVEDISDPFMKKVRQLDKVVDEIAKGRPVAKVMRSTAAGAV